MTIKNEFPFWNFVFKQGVIYGLVMLIISTSFDLLGIAQTNWSWLPLIPAIVILFYTIQERKKTQNNFITFSEGMSVGIVSGIIGGFISTLFSILYFNLILPERKQALLNASRRQIEERYPDMSEEQINQALSYSEYAFQPHIFLAVGMVVNIIFVSLVVLILAAILKKEKNNPFE
ncbi:MAG: DUF4199 domain-containing protein [Cytophagia bacterium]|nr:MAG: DUF4199 domain-containing protein [Cytophagales bacterium]TAG07057.1 MAG: DUF4199 domain-containing protein [Cytophagia bacterium]TAG40942.1 MAG: DUF4199 domain-containing protein [Cytophagia bacterium]